MMAIVPKLPTANHKRRLKVGRLIGIDFTPVDAFIWR